MTDNLTLSDIAAVSGKENGFGGDSMWIFALLILMLLGGGGWNNSATNAATTADIQRAVDLNGIQSSIAGVGNDIQRGIYEINGATKDAAYNNLSEIRDVGSAVATSGANIINNLTQLGANMQSCCCETKQQILENRYLDAQNTASINANTTAAMQKVLDTIQADKISTLEAQVSNLQTQNAIQTATAGVVKYPNASTYYAGANPFCSNCGSF